MKQLPHFLHRALNWTQIGMAGVVLASASLLWRVRDAPMQLAAGMQIDALSAFFIMLALSGLALVVLIKPPQARHLKRTAAASIVLLLTYATSNVLVIAGAYLLFALLAQVRRPPVQPPARNPRAALIALARYGFVIAPWLVAAVSLLLGYGALAARGALRYTDRSAGAALDSMVFWFVLLAALIPLVPWRSLVAPAPAAVFSAWSLALAWLYPLLRLYTLGPWNTGWSFATLLAGGALAAWNAIAALTEPAWRARTAKLMASYAGLALAAAGLGTSAGVAAACYGMLALLLLGAGLSVQSSATPLAGESAKSDDSARSQNHPAAALAPIGWFLAGVFPFTAPFVAVWMLIGASIAGSVALLGGIAWLVALINGLTIAFWSRAEWFAPRRTALALSFISVTLGVGAPLAIRSLIEPVVSQLQGGLSPYGDIVIWPWVGLAASDAAHTQVATLPSIAIALLMLVLMALVYVALRLRDVYTNPLHVDHSPATAPLNRLDVLRILRDEVPWLHALLGSRKQPEEPPRDRE